LKGSWINATIKDNYIASGSILNDSAVLQTDVGVNLPKGMTFDVWSNYVFETGKHNEHDITLTLPSFKLGKTNVSSSVGYWALPGFDLQGIKVASVNFDLPLPLNPRISVLGGKSKEFNGFNGSVTFGKEFALNDKLKVKAGGEIGLEAGLFTDRIGTTYAAGNLSATYTEGKYSVNVSARNQQPLAGFRNQGFDNKTTFSIGANYTF
jgi:hypothetical protein